MMDVASLCGLVMRRLQDEEGVQGVGAEDLTPVTIGALYRIFGEALQQATQTEEDPAPNPNGEGE